MIKQIAAEELTVEVLRSELSYNPETGEFRRLNARGKWKAGRVAGCYAKSTGYIVMDVLGVRYFAHRLAWLYMYGAWPVGLIDHINRCKTDNRIVNLRDVTHSGNLRNHRIRTDNSSGVSGVSWHRQKRCWRARAYVNGKEISLGLFHRKTDAARARKDWEVKNPIDPAEDSVNQYNKMAA